MTAILNGHMREFLASFDENVHLTDEQVDGVIADLDGWNQSRDGVYQLQTDGQENRARLYTILSERTGLNYQQAPKFFDKAQDLFLDRGIPFEPVAEESALVEAGTPSLEGAAVGASSILMARSLGGMTGKKDLAAIDSLLNALKGVEAYWESRLPLPSIGQPSQVKLPMAKGLPSFNDPGPRLSEVRQFKAAVEALRVEILKSALFMETAGASAGQEVLQGDDLAKAREMLATRFEGLRTMAVHYGRNQEIQAHDQQALQTMLGASRSVNALAAQWKPPTVPVPQAADVLRAAATTPRGIPAVVVPTWRAALSSWTGVVSARAFQSLTALRGLANGAAQFLTPWQGRLSAASRSAWPLAVAGASVGMIAGALGMLAAMPKPMQGERLLVPPARTPEPEPKPAAPAEKTPPTSPTIRIEDLPPAPAPAKTTARTSRGK